MDHPLTPVAPSPDWFDAPPPPPVAPPGHLPPPFAVTLRWLVQFGVVFFCLFLLVRTVGLEPFGVPTGSMAPALAGNHRQAACPRCDYPVVVGEPGPGARPVAFDRCRCPNCGAAVDLSAARELPGDRVLVDKTAYHARAPRRWEAAVFHCPVDGSKPYVKRVAGLPGELVQLSDGDVYADGELVRKTLAQVRETRVPVFDLNYPPRPDGWAVRWLVEPVQDPKLPLVSRPTPPRPVDEAILHDSALFLDGTATPEGVGLTYRHWNLDRREEEPVGYGLGYNGGGRDGRGEFAAGGSSSARDFLLSFDLEVLAGAGTFACRLGDGGDTVRADLPVGGDPAPPRLTHDGPEHPVAGPPVRLTAGTRYRVEFALVDRRASLAVDGREVVRPLDLPADPPGKSRRKAVSRPVQLGASGASVAVRNLRLDRDIYYLPGAAPPKAGWRLGADEFFMLGDNTSNSQDSREWKLGTEPLPGVPERDFIGKPFLIHQPMRLARVTVNGRDHTFQTLDWSRLRLLR